jgi:methionyl aminopeptidase
MCITTEEELAGMQAAGKIARQVLQAMRAAVRPGISTRELDEIGARVMTEHGAQSAPKLVYGFPGYSCISVNNEVVHGIPSDRVLVAGDLVKLDVTIEKGGFMADTAVTVGVGDIAEDSARLLACAVRAFERAMLVARAGFRVLEIGRAVEREARRDGFSVVRELCGHGIGRTIHELPEVPNYLDTRASSVLHEGLVITVEPILAAGDGKSLPGSDGWTVLTADHRRASHYEHTIVITGGRPLVLTAA